MTATDLDGNGTNNPSADRIRYSFRAITNANGNIVRETLTGAIGHRPRTKLGGLPLLPLREEGGGKGGPFAQRAPLPGPPPLLRRKERLTHFQETRARLPPSRDRTLRRASIKTQAMGMEMHPRDTAASAPRRVASLTQNVNGGTGDSFQRSKLWLFKAVDMLLVSTRENNSTRHFGRGD